MKTHIEEDGFEVNYESEFPEYGNGSINDGITYADIREHITGPVISTIIHIVILALLGLLIVIEVPEENEVPTIIIKDKVLKILPKPIPPEVIIPPEKKDKIPRPVNRPNL